MKIDRMIGILSILLQQEKVTASYLAEKFEVSQRTINRDIEHICRAGIPLVATRGIHGGISIMEGYKMDRTVLTSSELQAILTGLRSLDSISKNNRYLQLMEKLQAGASDLLAGNQDILIDLSSWYQSSLSPKIELIRHAILQSKKVSFRYFSPSGESSRIAEPYYLIFQWTSWYLWGWCETRQDFRLFKLNRILDLEMQDHFEKRPASLPNLSPQHIFPNHVRIKAVFAPEHQWRLIEEFGLESFTIQPDGKLLFSFDFQNPQNIISWILSFGTGAELLEPQKLRKELLTLTKNLAKQYES